MKLLQWNVWYKEDVQNILTLLRELDADVLCLQELTDNHPDFNRNLDVPHLIAKGLGFNYVFAPAVENLSEGSRYGNGIFSRYPIISSESHFIQDPPKSTTERVDYSEEGRIYLEARVNLNGREITIGTTHKSYTHGFVATPAKDLETNRLLQILKDREKDFIFSGDLNALPASFTVSEISKLLEHCGPDFGENTWTTKPFAYDGFEADSLNWRLDYCFATPDMGVKSAKIIRTNYSDHLPVLVEFQQ